MLVITIVIILFVLLVGRLILKKYDFLTLYCMIWLLVVSVRLSRMDDVIAVSDDACIVTFLSVVFFGLGYLLLSKKNINASRLRQYSIAPRRHEIRVKVIFFFLIIVAIFYIIQAIKVHALFAMGLSMDTIRYEYVTKGEVFTPVEQIISSWLTAPFVQYMIIPLNVCCLLSSSITKKTKTAIVLFSLIDISLYMYVILGKDNLIYYSLSLILLPTQFEIKKKYIKIIYSTIAGIFAVVFLLQWMRSDGESKDLNFIYGYLGISLNLFDYWSELIDSSHMQTSGLAFFYGPINVFVSVISKFGVEWPYFEKLTDFIGDCISTGVTVYPSQGATTNVYITHNFFFYMDGGLFGVVLGNFIYGAFVAIVLRLRRLRKNYNEPNMIVVENLVCVGALCCFIYWPFYSTPYCLSFVLLYICFKRNRVSVKLNKYEKS